MKVDIVKDKIGNEIEIGDTIVIPWENFDEGSLDLEIAVVKGIDTACNSVILDDGEPIPVDKYKVLIISK